MPYPAVDLTQVSTYPIRQRSSLVALENLILPDQPPPAFDNPDMAEIARRIVTSRRAGCQVIFMLGGHVVKCGLTPVVIEMMRLGLITHLASNGSATIHDFELALTGNTSEDVASSLEDGSFGMAEETGAMMNAAIQKGVLDDMGMGEALGRMIAEGEQFKFKQHSMLHQAYLLRIPYTVHVAVGTDIIHQHPACDFAALGWATGQDFKIFVQTVTGLEGGVFCNFGSSVIGPEVFLKSLSIARNLGHRIGSITTANFDLVPLAGDYRQPANKDNPEYYYRPKKNIVIRPNSLGGRGFHITGDHRLTIPNLLHLLKDQLRKDEGITVTEKLDNHNDDLAALIARKQIPSGTSRIPGDLQDSFPDLRSCMPAMVRAYQMIADCFTIGGTLFLCGNGGSFADALHIVGELNKSFKVARPIPEEIRTRLQQQPGGELLASMLQQGLRSIALGTNPSLLSAVDNDSQEGSLYFAQELYALARPGDILLGISTSGRARNVQHAFITAKVRSVKTILLTGPKSSPLKQMADIAICSPGKDTADIQAWHIRIYHALCEMLEQTFFGGDRSK